MDREDLLTIIVVTLTIICIALVLIFSACEGTNLRVDNAVLTQEVDALSVRNQSLKRNAVELAKENDELRSDINYLIDLLCGGEE